MSMQDKRKAFLGFGALAAVLIVAVIITWPPPYFDKTEATGAIGAVEKHRETQITPQDVVLGDEATRREQQIVFGHYLNDAGKLQSIVSELSARTQSANRAQAAVRALASMDDDMQARFAYNIEQAVASMRQALAREAGARARMAAVAAELDDIGARARGGQFANEDIQALSARVVNVAAQLQSFSWGMNQYARELANTEEMLGRVTAQLQARSAGREALARAAEDIDNGVRAMAARQMGVDFSDYADYLGRFAAQSRVLADAEQQLAAAAQLNDEEQMAARLNRVAQALADEALALEQRALQNAQKRLVAHQALAVRLRNVDQAMASVNRAVATRASFVANEDMQAFSRSMANFGEQLAARSQEFRARAAANIDAETAMLGAYLAARGQLHAQMLQVRPAFAARLANVDNIESHLASLDTALAGKSVLAAFVQDHEQLAARTQQLRKSAALQGTLN